MVVEREIEFRVEDMRELLTNLSELVDVAANSGSLGVVDSVISSLENCRYFVRSEIDRFS